VTTEELDDAIRAMLADHLNLEGGVMMMPLKEHEISYLHHAIRDLINKAGREVAR
jgi:hypothetical protein